MAIDKKYVDDCVKRLTPREKEILYRKCQGKTNDEIAEELFISINTVNDHFRDIYPKLGVEFQKRKGRLDKLYNEFCPIFLEIYTPPETVVEDKKTVGGVDQKKSPTDESGLEGESKPEEETFDGDTEKPAEESLSIAAETVNDQQNIKTGTVEDEPIIPPIPPFELQEPRRKWFEDLASNRSVQIIAAMATVLSVCVICFMIIIAIYNLVPPPPNPTNIIAQNPTLTYTVELLISLTDTATPTITDTLEPTATRPPTKTPIPTNTRTAIPAPPTRTITPLPENLIFMDDFSGKLSDQWTVVSGEPLIVNNKLSTEDWVWLSFSDDRLNNYRIEFVTDPGWCGTGPYNIIAPAFESPDKFNGFQWSSCHSAWYIAESRNWDRVDVTLENYGLDDLGEVLTIEIEVIDGYMSATISGHDGHSIQSKYPVNKIGLYLDRDTTVDEFRIYSIP